MNHAVRFYSVLNLACLAGQNTTQARVLEELLTYVRDKKTIGAKAYPSLMCVLSFAFRRDEEIPSTRN